MSANAAFKRDATLNEYSVFIKYEAKLYNHLLAAFYRLRKSFTIERIVNSNLDPQPLYEEAAQEYAAVYAVAMAGFTEAADKLTDKVSLSRRIRVVFNQLDPNVINVLQANQAGFVRELAERQRLAVREAVDMGTRAGENPRKQALRFRESIGLTEQQVRAVENYRNLVETQNAAALDRGLRDRRFDARIRSADPVPADVVDRMVQRYRERYLTYRAETIARTESLRSVNQGAHEAIKQMLARGNITEQEVTREWLTARDERVRSSHAAMNGQKVGVNDAFTSGNGYKLQFPGDPGAPASEVINCRCTVLTRVN